MVMLIATVKSWNTRAMSCEGGRVVCYENWKGGKVVRWQVGNGGRVVRWQGGRSGEKGEVARWGER